ncbi:hypothetical protein WA026_001656 [Henosepilachna vigintioctopunctata]|uniref:lysozyme n=1 Tax=Henosepilachna vigintioctopunctata TaxID=420089 RepID=A0AAW1UIN6_9CUCU
MKIILVFLISCVFCVNCLDNLIGTDDEKCLRCICYATTFCNHLENCVKLWMNESYWEAAGSPTLNAEIPSPAAYRNCMADTNCLLNTMKVYTSVGGSNRDANCDGKFDCKDRLAVHFKGHTNNYTLESYRVRRFDFCAVDKKIPVKEGWSACDLEAINEVFSNL